MARKPSSPGEERDDRLVVKPGSRVQGKYHNRPKFGQVIKDRLEVISSRVFDNVHFTSWSGVKRWCQPPRERKVRAREEEGRDKRSAWMDGYQMNARELGAQGKKTEEKTQYQEPCPQRRVNIGDTLRRGLVLRGHAVADRHTRILATCLLLLLEVLIVGHLLLLLIGHVARVHARTRHIGLGCIDVVADILGGLGRDIGSINTILVGSRVGRVQAGLEGILLADSKWRASQVNGVDIPG